MLGFMMSMIVRKLTIHPITVKIAQFLAVFQKPSINFLKRLFCGTLRTKSDELDTNYVVSSYQEPLKLFRETCLHFKFCVPSISRFGLKIH